MELRPLGNSDLRITPLGFGTWTIGGAGWQFAWGPTDDRESIAAIQHALDLGINWIDTAAVYGGGHSEELVGQALAGRATQPYVFTKCGRQMDAHGKVYGSLRATSIRRELEGSLRRLRREVIDLYQIHWPDPQAEIEEGWSELAKLQQERKVRWIGVSNFNREQLERARRIAPVTSLQPPYSLLRRDSEAMALPYCLENHIGVIAYSPLASGLLAGGMSRERAIQLPENDWRRGNPEFQEPRLAKNLQLVEKLRALGARHGRSPAEVALAWVLRLPAVTGAIAGARRPEQLDGLIGAMEFRLADAEQAEIQAALDRLHAGN